MTTKDCCKQECCKIDAIVSVDSKGQIVLPKELREKSNIQPNDKLAVIGFQRENQICCIVMVKTDALEGPIKNLLGPVFQNILQPEMKKQ